MLAVITSVLLSACGGGGTTLAGGGISGTGISMGRITNFGSIIVNGVKFDVNGADFIRDEDTESEQDDYSVGEYIVVKGTIDESGLTGIADEVMFTNELEGAVTLASTDGLTLEVLGQKVMTNALTVFIGFEALSNLKLDNIVEVSGTRNSDGDIQATSIKLKSDTFVSGSSENELKGFVSELNTTLKTFMINNITIDYTDAIPENFGSQVLADGLYVEVESDSIIVANVLKADTVELKDESSDLLEGYEAHIEGQITRFVSDTDFEINGLSATTNQDTEYSDGNVTDLAEGVFIEIEGETNSEGIIVAESIEFEEEDNELDELEDLIESINVGAGTVVVSGKTVLIDQATIMIDGSDLKLSSLTINDLAVTDKINVLGVTQSNGELLAIRFERKEVLEE